MKKTLLILGAVVLLTALLFLTGTGEKAPQEQSLGETTAYIETEEAEPSVTAEPTEEETLPKLPDSVLYYGEILKILTDEQGKPGKLSMDSQRSGPYIMNLSDKTVFLDSGERTSFDPSILKEGDRVYVFMSPISFRSMPPQSSALAVIRNIHMDAGCAMYHEIESLQEKNGQLFITTDNGEKTLLADENTELLTYAGEKAGQADLKAGGFLMAWYWDRGEEILHPSHLMILPE